ncbi:uroporphyrinogen-III C-methyltransferase [Thauera sp.]|jgi:uroporphyrin-3 C-methyltransferase|uniref:uroporphyrinogen-III C-methyltransferase n=1 Tax=Thauera sp. TaxID=1905334 RepID=UPI002A36AC85|nr:uroporphyrinogen-III C-methyltransferase [Thauera sp.]MDX9885159.1 uroporphyrinogen-III C-methyltransferase [Thauera sp.]
MKEEIPALIQPPPTAQHASAKDDQGSVREDAREPVGAEVQTAAPTPPATTGDAGESGRSPAAWWALLLALIAIGGAGWAIWQARDTRVQSVELREELARRLSEGESIATEARGIVRQQQEVIASLQGKLGMLESKVETTEGQAAALEALYQEFSRSREDGVIAEVEQAVALAAQQLQIAGNVEAALIALQEAEARLAIHDRGQLASLRRALARDIDELRQQPVLDVSGLSLRLERLLERADALPLAFEGQLPVDAAVGSEMGPADSGGLAGWMAGVWRFTQALTADVWHEVRTLVRVERLDQDDPVLLAPAQNTFLRENLKIRLLTARLALLARDGRTYEADLAQAKAWVERFFDLREERVQVALNELTELHAVKVRYEPPDLSETFSALRTAQARSGRPPLPAEPARPGTVSPVAPVAEPAPVPAAAEAVAAEQALPASPSATEAPVTDEPTVVTPATSGASAPAASE